VYWNRNVFKELIVWFVKMVMINIGRKELVVFVGVLVLVLGVGFGVAYGGNQPSVVGHSAGEIEGGAGEEVRVWQNMGPSIYQDSRDHSTSCDSGYLMSGVRVYVSVAVDGFMTAQCIESSFLLSGSTIKGPLGNLDNQFQSLNCDNNQVIRSITFYSGSMFDYNLRLNCGSLVGASLDNSNTLWALNLYGGANNDMYSSEVNVVYDNKPLFVECPQGYVATGIKAYASSYIENFDFLCKKII
ncbi:MAG: hypothetical protein KJ592_04300, partial [Nanoarchaeota archaeon]|nr:hypothetical protein [Nanoarchaeota archaeon]